VSAARLGLPDTELISFAEMLDSLRSCCVGAGAIPVIGDGDTGYGNALNVQRTVVEYARAGAAAVMIEDQVSPKKCGHTRGKQVVGREEARMKIRAAVEARAGADILIMARTDARAVHGFDDALERCRVFAAEGADIIFLEAPESEDEMHRFCQAMHKPCMANLVPGGKTPILPPARLQEIGYKLALYPVAMLSASIAAMQATLGSEDGFARWHSYLSHPLVKLFAIACAWAYAHHFFAGIRYLLLDMHWGIEKAPARASANTVLVLGILAALVFAWRIW